jgi:hypothetical protein
LKKRLIPTIAIAIAAIAVLAGCSGGSTSDATSIKPQDAVIFVEYSDGVTANCAAFDEVRCTWRKSNDFDYNKALEKINVDPGENAYEEDLDAFAKAKKDNPDSILKVTLTTTNRAGSFYPSKTINPDKSISYCLSYSTSYASCTHLFKEGTGTTLESDNRDRDDTELNSW